MTKVLTVFPIVFVSENLKGEKDAGACSGTLISDNGDVITCAHFCTKEYRKLKKYLLYEEEVKRINSQSYSTYLKRKKINNLEYNVEWIKDVQLYFVNRRGYHLIDIGRIHIDQKSDIAIINTEALLTDGDEIDIREDVVVGEELTMAGYVLDRTKNALDINSYTLNTNKGIYEGLRDAQNDKYGIVDTFGVFSNPALKGMSGGPVIKEGSIVGIQSMTSDMVDDFPTSTSKSFFVLADKINRLLSKSDEIRDLSIDEIVFEIEVE